MKFYLYTGNKLERLAEKFISLVCGSLPADVFTPETVVVQTQGMAAWLKLRIGDSGRIAANFDTPFLVQLHQPDARSGLSSVPGRLRAVLDRTPAVENLPDSRTGAGALPELAAYLSGPPGGTEALAARLPIADLFDQYQIYRPKMLEEWRAGNRPEWNDADWQKRLYLELRGGHKGRGTLFLRILPAAAVPPARCRNGSRCSG